MDTESKALTETTKQCQHFLPAELLLYIFKFLDAHTLAINCRGACKFWKETVESSDMWKIQLRRTTASNETINSILPTAHNVYPWYICYALCKNVFGTNLFPRSTPEEDVAGHPQRYWARDLFHNRSGFIYYALIGSYPLVFSPPPQELINEGIDFCFLGSIGECSSNNIIDLYARGFTRKILEFCPPIVISEWFTIRRNYVGVYHLCVLFFNAKWSADYENGRFEYRRRIDLSDWYTVTHTFTNYKPDVRYISFEHGVDIHFPPTYRRYRDDDTRDPGSKMAGGKLVINIPKASNSE